MSTTTAAQWPPKGRISMAEYSRLKQLHQAQQKAASTPILAATPQVASPGSYSETSSPSSASPPAVATIDIQKSASINATPGSSRGHRVPPVAATLSSTSYLSIGTTNLSFIVKECIVRSKEHEYYSADQTTDTVGWDLQNLRARLPPDEEAALKKAKKYGAKMVRQNSASSSTGGSKRNNKESPNKKRKTVTTAVTTVKITGGKRSRQSSPNPASVTTKSPSVSPTLSNSTPAAPTASITTTTMTTTFLPVPPVTVGTKNGSPLAYEISSGSKRSSDGGDDERDSKRTKL